MNDSFLKERTIMVKHVSEFRAYLKPPMQIKATKQDSIKCFNTREKTAFTCSKAIEQGELTSELEAKFKINTRSVLNMNSQVRSMGVPLKGFPAEVPKTPNFLNQIMEYRIELSCRRWA